MGNCIQLLRYEFDSYEHLSGMTYLIYNNLRAASCTAGYNNLGVDAND